MEVSTKKRTIADFFSDTPSTREPLGQDCPQTSADTRASASGTRDDVSDWPKKLKLTASNGHDALARLGSGKRRLEKKVETDKVEGDLGLTDIVDSKPKKLKKKGKPSFLPSLPLDILYEIFKLLPPTELLALSRTSRALRSVLLHRSAMTVWMASSKHVPDFPPLPSDMSLPAWSSLLLDTHCQNCLANNAHVDFVLRIRCCSRCAPSLLVPLSTYPDMYSILLKAVPSSHWNSDDEQQFYGSKKEVDAFLTKWKTRTELGDQLVKERALVASRNEIGEKAQDWTCARYWLRAAELENLRAERKSEIEGRLIKMGYRDELSFLSRLTDLCVIDPLPSDIPAFEDHPHVNQPCALTDSTWKTIKSDMVQLMLRVRGVIQENERCLVIRERRALMHRRYLDWRNQKEILNLYPAHYFMPSPLDVIEHYQFAGTLELPCEVKIDSWAKIIDDKLHATLPTFVRSWREESTNFFLDELEYAPAVPDKLQWHMSGSFRGAPMHRKHEQLELATVVFRCTDQLVHSIVDGIRARDEGASGLFPTNGKWERIRPLEPAPLLWYPAFLTHPCASIRHCILEDGRPLPEAYLCLNGIYVNRNSIAGLYQKEWSSKHLEFDELASKTVSDILDACGLSNATTVVELDEYDPRLVCLRCSFGIKPNGDRPMRVMGWREAVNHSVKAHFGNSRVKWERLSPEDTAEAMRLEAQEKMCDDYPTLITQKVWRCTRCMHTERDDGRMTWVQLQYHFERYPTHGNVDDIDNELNRTYFKDPEMIRRALPRITMVPGKVSPQ